MQKKLWQLALTGVLAGTIAACGVQTQVPAASEGTDKNGAAPAEQTRQPAAKEPEIVFPDTFERMDTLVFPGKFEFSILSTEFATKVEPPKPGSFHSFYEVKDTDKVYSHIVIRVKNLGGSNVSADDILQLKVKYDGKYEYSGFTAVEEDDGSDFTYANITSIPPLTSKTLHVLAEVPKEVQESGKSVEWVVKADGKTITTAGTETGGQTLVMAKEHKVPDNVKWQEYEKLTAGEVKVVGEYAEIAVTQAELTTVVKPPKPGMFHTYYEVKAPDKIYAHLAVSFKNVAASAKGADEALTVRVIYDNKYEYRGFATVEEGGGEDFNYANITRIDPLATERLHYLFELPAEAKDNQQPIAFVIQANGQNFGYVLER